MGTFTHSTETSSTSSPGSGVKFNTISDTIRFIVTSIFSCGADGAMETRPHIGSAPEADNPAMERISYLRSCSPDISTGAVNLPAFANANIS